MQFSVQWPARTRLIPDASESLRIRAIRNGIEVGNQVVARPETGNTSTVQMELPPGVIICTVTAHPNSSGTGTAQALGSAEVSIRSNKTTSASLTLNSTIQAISFNLPPENIRPGQQIDVTAQAKDSSGAFVITSSSKWAWSSSNTAAVQVAGSGANATLTPGTTRGSSTITARETESGKTATFTITNLVATSEDDYPLFSKIEKARIAASNIVIDGDDSDWADIPSYPDPTADNNGVVGLDILSTSIAATEDAFYVRFKTDRTLSFDNNKAYQVNFDITDSIWSQEIGFAFTPAQTGVTFWIFEPGQSGVFHELNQVEKVSMNGITEMKIPYAIFSHYLPASMQNSVPSPANRPHVRAWVTSHQKVGNTWPISDSGDCAGTYILKPTPYDLGDTPLPRSATSQRVVIRPPLPNSACYVTQGAFGSISHQAGWAYDIITMDRQFYSNRVPGSTNNTDYVTWNHPIVSGAAGTVIYVRNDAPDLPAGGPPDNNAPANQVTTRIAGGLEVSYIHTRQSSALVGTGQSVTEGQQIASVGNSGPSTGPHLHLQSQLAGTWQAENSVTTSLKDVRLLLVPWKDDPWKRDLPVWDIREGYMFSGQ